MLARVQRGNGGDGDSGKTSSAAWPWKRRRTTSSPGASTAAPRPRNSPVQTVRLLLARRPISDYIVSTVRSVYILEKAFAIVHQKVSSVWNFPLLSLTSFPAPAQKFAAQKGFFALPREREGKGTNERWKKLRARLCWLPKRAIGRPGRQAGNQREARTGKKLSQCREIALGTSGNRAGGSPASTSFVIASTKPQVKSTITYVPDHCRQKRTECVEEGKKKCLISIP